MPDCECTHAYSSIFLEMRYFSCEGLVLKKTESVEDFNMNERHTIGFNDSREYVDYIN